MRQFNDEIKKKYKKMFYFSTRRGDDDIFGIVNAIAQFKLLTAAPYIAGQIH